MKQTVVITLSVIVFLLFMYMIFKKPSAAASSDKTNLNNAIQLAMYYLGNSTRDNGRFVYNSNVNPDIVYSDTQYNALRHAGTLYSMYLCERVLKDYSLREKRYLASKYFIDNYVQQIAPEIYAVVSKPSEEKLEFPQAKTGGTGLALIGLSNLYPEGKIDLKILRGLGNFTVYMQKTDGSFYSKYNVPQKQKDDKFVSLYYPGEVAYGLLFLNEVDPDQKWVETSKKALLFLANSRKDAGLKVPFDHWAMLATRKLFETPDNGLSAPEKVLLQRHAEQMAMSILDTQIIDEGNTYRGGFVENVRLCSIGTIMEGLVAIYYCIEDKALKAKILNAVNLGTDFLSRFQIKEGKRRGGIPTNAYWRLSNANDKSKVIRIDNVQHVLSAWITYSQISKN